MPRPTSLPASIDFLRLLWLLDHDLHAASARMLDRLGITGPQRLALRLIQARPGITTGELARTLYLHPSTVSGLLKRLEHLGLVVRRVDAIDRRIVSVRLTPKGRRLAERVSQTIEARLGSLVARRGARWRTQALGVVESLAAALRTVAA